MSDEINEVIPEVTADAPATAEAVVEPVAAFDATPDADATTADATPEKTVSQEEYNKLYFQMKQSERDMEALKATQTAPSTAAPVDAPVLEDFDYDDDKFQAASIQYQVKQQVQAALATQATAATQTAEETAQADRNNIFNTKAEAYALANPDYNRAIQATQGLVFPAHIQEVLLSSEHGPQLDYMLINDLQLFQRISTMNPTAAIMELGRMEGNIKVPVVAARQVSQAPDPIDTVSGAARVSGDYRTDDNISMDDYYKHHQADLRAKVK